MPLSSVVEKEAPLAGCSLVAKPMLRFVVAMVAVTLEIFAVVVSVLINNALLVVVNLLTPAVETGSVAHNKIILSK